MGRLWRKGRGGAPSAQRGRARARLQTRRARDCRRHAGRAGFVLGPARGQPRGGDGRAPRRDARRETRGAPGGRGGFPLPLVCRGRVAPARGRRLRPPLPLRRARAGPPRALPALAAQSRAPHARPAQRQARHGGRAEASPPGGGGGGGRRGGGRVRGGSRGRGGSAPGDERGAGAARARELRPVRSRGVRPRRRSVRSRHRGRGAYVRRGGDGAVRSGRSRGGGDGARGAPRAQARALRQSAPARAQAQRGKARARLP
mmetsp:Transcript_14018/g.46028  ORF Transcript_14018/g.46028 Transcript_14018/m.46028 type:complete len:259 (-) Transcript_14018:388-1164(-)